MALALAALQGDIDELYALIATDPKILADIDEIPFVDTPLHIAAKQGCTHFALEMMCLMPSFAKKLNPDSLTPLDVALRNNQTETVKRLVEIDSELIRIKGKRRWTPLHYVAQTDNVDLLAIFLYECPLSIYDLTVEKETALHIAASYGNIAAMEVLVGWAKRTGNREMLRWKDDRGNTALHVVAHNPKYYANSLSQVLENLSEDIQGNAKNRDQLKAVDIILGSTEFLAEQKKAAKRILGSQLRNDLDPEFRGSVGSSQAKFSKYLRSRLVLWEKAAIFMMNFSGGLTNERVNIILVVATLIITTSYAAALQSPSGLSELLHIINSTNPTNTLKFQMAMFHTLNSFTFYTSVAIVLSFLEFTLASMLVHSALFYFSITFAMLGSYQNNSGVVKFTTYGLLSLCITIFLWKLFVNCALTRMLTSKNSKNLVARRYMEIQQNVKL